MAKVKIGVARLNAVALLQKAEHVQLHITGNSHFPLPNPALADIANICNKLKIATQNALNRDKEKVAVRNVYHKKLKTLMSQLAYYVQEASGGDGEKIISSGFELAAPKARLGLPPIPMNLTARPGWDSGEILLRWKRVAEARGYILEMTEGNPNDEALWKVLTMVTKAKFKITGLTTGRIYWFRVLAVNAAGTSGQSDPAKSIAP